MVLAMEEPNVWEKFGEWVKQRRVSAKLTQAELAERAELTRQHIWNTENATSGVKRATVESIALALGVTPNEALLAAGFLPERIAEPRLTYERDDVQELLSAYEGIPPPLQPAALTAVKALRDATIKERDRYTIGRRVEEEPEI